MDRKPDFFISTSGESTGDLCTPRACWIEGRLKDRLRDDLMLVKVDPPVIGQTYGLGDQDITHLVIATRHKGFTLFPITEWPAHVYICRILLDEVVSTKFVESNSVEMIGWGRLFCSLDDVISTMA
jgi:hypothetical protein